MKRFVLLTSLALSCICAGSAEARSTARHNVVLFVPDGLRALMVTSDPLRRSGDTNNEV